MPNGEDGLLLQAPACNQGQVWRLLSDSSTMSIFRTTKKLAKCYYIACGGDSGDFYGASYSSNPTASTTIADTRSDQHTDPTTDQFTPPINIDTLIQGIQHFAEHMYI